MRIICSLVFTLLMTTITHAEAILYLGVGKAEVASASNNGDTPFSIGYMNLKDEGAFYGLDLGFEGTVLDSTYGQDNVPNRALSVNLIYGTNVSKTAKGRLDAGVLVGVRQENKDCANSYLGYACYADTLPDVEYGLNFGALVTYSFESFAVGLRATGESTQFLLGSKF